MHLPRRAASAATIISLAVAATFTPGLILHQSAHALPTSHQHYVAAPQLPGSSIEAVSYVRPNDPTANPAVHAALMGSAGFYGAALIDFIVKLTKKLVTAAEDAAESSSSDSSSSTGVPQQQELKRLFPSGDQQFNANT